MSYNKKEKISYDFGDLLGVAFCIIGCYFCFGKLVALAVALIFALIFMLG